MLNFIKKVCKSNLLYRGGQKFSRIANVVPNFKKVRYVRQRSKKKKRKKEKKNKQNKTKQKQTKQNERTNKQTNKQTKNKTKQNKKKKTKSLGPLGEGLCYRHGVIGAHKMNPNFGFLVAFGGNE